MKYMIIGGVAGGASTAARLRRLDEQAEIILFEKGEYISYANCGLPYYIGGVIEERERLFVQTPESFKARFNIEVRIKSEVKAIEPENKQVVIKDWATGKTYRESFDKLVLSPAPSRYFHLGKGFGPKVFLPSGMWLIQIGSKRGPAVRK